jgi:hypothetical protein
MSKLTKAQRQERQEAIDQLREWLKPGDTVYTILDHVSSSGMMRAIRVVLPTIGGPSVESTAPGGKPTDYVRKDGITVDFVHPNWAVGKALGLKHWKRNGREQDALVVGGCGMDMGFHLVYELSHVLYGAAHKPGDLPDQIPDQSQYATPAPAGWHWEGGYACLGKGKCPSNYHVNHRDMIRCEGTRQYNPDGPNTGSICYRPHRYNSRFDVPDDWPKKTITIDGATIDGGYLACIEHEDGTREVCPTCKGAGQIPNPAGPERFDLMHTDGYALRHRWL